MAERNPNSKQSKAIELVRNARTNDPTVTRKVLIATIMEQCGMSQAGASTYYQNAVSYLRTQGQGHLTKAVTPAVAPVQA